MEKIILKSEYLELLKFKKELKPISSIELDESEVTIQERLYKEVDNCLDQLIRIEILLKSCDSINEFKEQDYIDYLNFLENENMKLFNYYF